MENTVISFNESLKKSNLYPLKADTVDTLQINLGKMCNQACQHCHVEAGPNRTEIMGRDIMMYCIDAFTKSSLKIADLTGGAPEMNPYYRWFVERLFDFGAHVITRCNLTILTEEGYEYLPELYKENEVEVVASLPCYTEETVNAQRGDNVFEASIEGLKKLNSIGYGDGESGMVLNLVYNPAGAFLPPSEAGLQEAYKKELKDKYGIFFNSLYALTNMPIGRYKNFLEREGGYNNYIKLLVDGYNPEAAKGVMCRTAISVGYDGYLYDCDFNQMLEIKVGDGTTENLPTHIKDFNQKLLEKREIITDLHCYGCTAGSGSSCTGSLQEGN